MPWQEPVGCLRSAGSLMGGTKHVFQLWNKHVGDRWAGPSEKVTSLQNVDELGSGEAVNGSQGPFLHVAKILSCCLKVTFKQSLFCGWQRSSSLARTGLGVIRRRQGSPRGLCFTAGETGKLQPLGRGCSSHHSSSFVLKLTNGIRRRCLRRCLFARGEVQRLLDGLSALCTSSKYARNAFTGM